MRYRAIHGILFALALLTRDASGASGLELSVTFEKIVETGAAMPAGQGAFSGFDAPALDLRNIAFKASRSDGQKGIFLKSPDSGMEIVANTFGHGPYGFFTDLREATPSLSGENVAFVGARLPGYHGIFTNVNGLTAIATTQMPRPVGDHNFDSLTDPTISGETVAFIDDYMTERPKLYRSEAGALSLVDPLPWQPSYAEPSMSGDQITFLATNMGGGFGDWRVYSTTDGNSFQNPAGSGPPGGGSWVEMLGAPVLDGTNIAFSARSGLNGELPGVYANINGSLVTIADGDTAMPGSIATFDQFNVVSLSGETVAFIGYGTMDYTAGGIFVYDQATLHRLVGPSDILDGKVVSTLFMSKEALSGDQISFVAHFTDGTQAIYVASIPEPSSAVLLALAGFGIGHRRRTSAVKFRP